MSTKTMAWTLLAVIAFATVLLFNYWAAYQPLSTLAYAGIVAALAGLANLVLPFRFLGIRKRIVGALIFAGGVALAFAALCWPASMIGVAQPRTRLDAVMPEYQFFEKHSARVHARPQQVMQAVRESKFGDIKSVGTLLRIRAAALRIPYQGTGEMHDMRVLEAFSKSGYLSDSSENQIVMFGGANVRAKRRLDVHTAQEFADSREPETVKMAFDFIAEDAGGGWSTVSTETRVVALGDVRRGMGRYWRLIVPGSGLLRRQWLDSIKNRAENMPAEH
jgi:hypothetical protein